MNQESSLSGIASAIILGALILGGIYVVAGIDLMQCPVPWEHFSNVGMLTLWARRQGHDTSIHALRIIAWIALARALTREKQGITNEYYY